MDEGHRADSCLGARAGAAGAQVSPNGIEEDTQGAVERLAVVLEMIAQTLGHGEHPLAHRQTGQDMMGQLGGERASERSRSTPPTRTTLSPSGSGIGRNDSLRYPPPNATGGEAH